MKTWLHHTDLPPFEGNSAGNIEHARAKRLEIVEWLNGEIKRAFIEQERLNAFQRFRDLKHFATCIRTNKNLQWPEWWTGRASKTGEEFLSEYLEGRASREKERAATRCAKR